MLPAIMRDTIHEIRDTILVLRFTLYTIHYSLNTNELVNQLRGI